MHANRLLIDESNALFLAEAHEDMAERYETSRKGLLAYAPWPQVDARMLVDDEIEIAVQVLGKVRGHAKVANGAANDVVLAAARAAVAAWLDGKLLVKEIVVPGKLVNFVVK